ncbi:flagellar basal body-associated FliL family protein [Halanaerobiaceae bacterium Z-7014]|uniref:Flagellar protein FliL n=1 Tax=Halonatronomonas betaini TaxID=2778430 RepID=A0A931APK3_9FIRM|nr:flagellar basal body-associated FliL family protein [Halonatronomonas betaini]MBF8435694.1 flagellar basal body-associated FliL family protein [Halonatronomonas betaini]
MAEDGSKLGKIMTYVGVAFLIVVLAAATSFGVLWYMTRDTGPDEIEDRMGPTYQLGEYTVNLSGTGGFQYLQTNIVIEASEDVVLEEIDKRSPQIDDAIISTLRSQSIDEIQEPGANEIKKQLADSINEVIRNGEVRNVWFTQFVVQ